MLLAQVAVVLVLLLPCVRLQSGQPTRYTLDSSPYNITQDIRIPTGATVVIEAGVTLRFATRVRLINEGTLKVLGTRDKQVLFTALNAPPDRYPYMDYDMKLIRWIGNLNYLMVWKEGWYPVCNLGWKHKYTKMACENLGFPGVGYSTNSAYSTSVKATQLIQFQSYSTNATSVLQWPHQIIEKQKCGESPLEFKN